MNAELLAELEAIEALSAKLLHDIERLSRRLEAEQGREAHRRWRDRDDEDEGGD